MSFRLLVVVVTLGLAAALHTGCESGPRRAGEPHEPARDAALAAPAPVDTSLDVEQVVDQVERLRDREFDTRPTIEPVSAIAPRFLERAMSEAARADRAAILTGLWGLDPKNVRAVPSPLDPLARYDADGDRVLYVADHADVDRLRVALAAALVEALDARLSSAPAPEATSWDAYLAHEAARQAAPMFVAVQAWLAAQERQDDVPPIDAHLLARRPEVALGAAGDTFRALFEDDGPEAEPDRGPVRFAMREGYTLASALYRANGWSAIELAIARPPETSLEVVRPDRYLAGEGAGQWQWPRELETTREASGWTRAHSGHVGPALTAMWLSRTVDARTARTVYAGMRSDAYRFYRGGDASGAPAGEPGAWVFEWVSQWDTPHSAAQIAAAFDLTLRRQRPSAGTDGSGDRGGDDGRVHHAVVHKGLTVAVVVHARPFDPAALDNSATLLASARAGYVPGPGLGLSFVPTRIEDFAARADAATLDGTAWRDPGLGVAMQLDAIGDWTLQKTDERSIRWFARHEGDGALVQLTTELVSPLAPTFASPGYVEHLRRTFHASLGGAGEAPQVARVAAPDGASGGVVLELRGQGAVDGRPQALLVRQALHGDVLLTYSLQAAPERFDAHVEAARAVFDTLVLEAHDGEAPAEEGGILEFVVEED